MHMRRFSLLLLLACLLPAACAPPAAELMADLSISSISGPSGPVKAIDPWTLGCVVVNLGDTDAPATTVRFYYSADATLDAGDDPIGVDLNVPALSLSASHAVTLPSPYAIADSGGSPGTHWIFAVVDPSSLIADGDPSNNSRSLGVTILYERLIIDTYKPTGGGQIGTTDTFATLFDSTFSWVDEDQDGNPIYTSAARIDYTDPVGYAPGTVLYVKVEGKLPLTSGPYAVRLLIDTPGSYDSSWFYAADNASDTPYENDDPATGGAPVLLTVGEKHNRYLDAGDVDWFQLVLP